MPKVIHQSWRNLGAGAPEPGRSIVTFDFTGRFTEGSYEGTLFAGRIRYDRTAVPTERHESFAVYEGWADPIVTMAVGGQVLTAQGAAVYDSVIDGRGGNFDFVNLYGTGRFDQVDDMAFFELLFAAENASALDGTRMPSAQRLLSLPVKKFSFGTNAPGNVMSFGEFTLMEIERPALAPREVEKAR